MYKVGELATLFNISADTLRFYEKNGILKASERSSNGYRLYTEADKNRLDFILNAKSAGFTLVEISELLVIEVNKNQKTCRDTKELIDHKLSHVQAKIQELQRIEKALKTLSNSCEGDSTSALYCTILESLESKKI
jgi:MerR family Zn(II)-responsive transcriptional regulator of zntA